MEEVQLPAANRTKLRRWRSREWLLAAAVMLAGLMLAYFVASAPLPDLSRQKYERIQRGMTQEEVEQIIGTRPGGYCSFVGPGEQLSEEWGHAVHKLPWGDRFGVLSVGFDEQGRVCGKWMECAREYGRVASVERSWWDRLLHRTIPSREPTIIYISF